MPHIQILNYITDRYHITVTSAPVHDHVPVAVLHPRDDLLEEVPRLVLRQPALLNNVVKQLATLQATSKRLPETYHSSEG
jgi:hypothetical protein